MRIALLGSLQVESGDGVAYALRGAKQRTLVALLALRNGEIVTVDEMIDALRGDDEPAVATNAIHAQVSKLRRALASPTDTLPLRTVNRGYVLDLASEDLDATRFERLAADGSGLVASGRYHDGLAALDDALGLWRGPALAEFAFADFASAERLRLDELRATVQEHRIDALLGLGRHELLVAELEGAVRTSPLRERAWAQLMTALYRSGRQADALRAYARARSTLIDEMGIEPGSALRELEQRILQQHPALDIVLAPPRGSATVGAPLAPTAPTQRGAYTTNLRRELSAFVGRRAELETLTTLVGTRRLVTMIGPGGVGKTRLASEIALRSEEAWRDGTWMLELHATSGPDGVARALLSAFGGHAGAADASTDVRAAVDLVAGAIGGAAVLLVLDNCEHVVAEIGAAATMLLQRCANLRVLATSRVVLDISGETVRQVKPLAIDDAVTLFAARGLDAREGFALDGANDDTVRSICNHVDCLPLGIELAAARLRAFTPAQLEARLAHSLGGIAATSRSRAARHRTMAATVAWSYQLLFDDERTLLRRLSVFRGTFALEAVEAVASDDDVPAVDVADTLARLVDKSLVVSEGGGGEARYRLLRTIGDFAAAEVVEQSPGPDLRARHASWVATLAARAGPGLNGPEQAGWIARLRDEGPNVDAALAYAHHGGDVSTGLRTCIDLAWFALTTINLPTLLDDLLSLLALPDGVPPALRARGLTWAGVIGAGLPQAQRMSEEAIELARRSDDDRLLAEALIVAGMPMSRRIEHATQAIELAREGRVLAERTGNAWLVAASYAVEGGARSLTVEDLAAAAELLQRAGAGYLDIGDRASAEINAWYLSQIHEDLGDVDRAESVLLPFVNGARSPESAGAILALARLSWLAQRRGDVASAAAHAERLAAPSAVRQRRLFWGAARFAIGHAALAAGDLDSAQASLVSALDMHSLIGFDRFVILEHTLLGETAQRQGRDADSRRHHNEAIRTAQTHVLPLPTIIALEHAAQSALRRRDFDQAIELHRRAAALHDRHKLPPTRHEETQQALIVEHAETRRGRPTDATAKPRQPGRCRVPDEHLSLCHCINLRELGRSDRAVRELTELLDVRQNLVSYHLKQLGGAGVVRSRHSSADRRDRYYAIDLVRCGELLQASGASLHPSLRLVPALSAATPVGHRSRRRPRVLFLCTGNSARSQMAEALLVQISEGAVDAASAGSNPKPLHPNTVRVMQRRGIDISGNHTKHFVELASQRFDIVVTLCDRVREVCPEFPSHPNLVHWSVPDPALTGPNHRVTYPTFEQLAAELETRVRFLLGRHGRAPTQSAAARRHAHRW